MFGGVGKAGWATILVTGGLMLGTSISAQAADLGGDCCADLEERVAELEATTARKGNRKVKLEIYGQVNEAVMFWDDGYERNAYVVTNDASRTRVGFKGGAKINDDWSANFKIEIGIRSANSKRSNQNDPLGTGNPAVQFDVRHAWWNLKSKTYGTFQVGHTPTATEEITEANLAGTSAVGKYSDVEDSGLGMRLRASNNPALSGVQWRNLIRQTGDQPGEGERRQAVYYISPEFAGFTASAGWGADDSWDAGLRYEGEFNGFKIEAGIAYGENTDSSSDDSAFFGCIADNVAGASSADCEQIGGSISVLHEPSGLYTNFAAGSSKDNTVLQSAIFAGKNADDESTFWAMEAGIHKKWLDLGPTTIFAQYYQMDGGANERQAVGGADAINPGIGAAHIFSSELDMWGVGVAQDIKAANIKLYALFRHYEAGVVLTQDAGAAIVASDPLKDLDVLMTGAIIKF